MPNIQSLLNAQIARVTRRELKSQANALRKVQAKQRAEISALKKALASLAQRVAQSEKPAGVATLQSDSVDTSTPRFSAKALAAQRRRLGISAADLGILLGVSALSVYHWENGKSKPRARYLESIAALKTLGKKQAEAIVKQRSASVTA